MKIYPQVKFPRKQNRKSYIIVAACDVNNAYHAMVLDSIIKENNEYFFKFKNTFKDNKHVIVSAG